MIECGTERTNLDSMKVCRFDLNQFMDTPCVKRLEYGFEDGTPCILIKLNRIYGWVPEPLDVPLPGSGSFNATDRGAEIECHGVNQGDKENVGPIFYYPQNYFSTRYSFALIRLRLLLVRADDTARTHRMLAYEYVLFAGSTHIWRKTATVRLSS